MKLYRAVLITAIASFLPACTSQSTSDCQDTDGSSNEAMDPGAAKPTPPDPIPGSAKMETVIGPLAPNLAKWGPEDEHLPFSWPGRAVQREPAFPQEPSSQLIYEVRLPEGSQLYKIHVWVDPADGHKDVPASRAGVMVWTHNGGMHESKMIASATTMDDSVANYEQRYLLTMSFDEPYIAKADTRVFIDVMGEWGENFMPGLAVDTPEIVFGE